MLRNGGCTVNSTALSELMGISLAVLVVLAQAVATRLEPNYAHYLGVVIIGCACGIILQFMATVKVHDATMHTWTRRRLISTLASGPVSSFVAAVICIEWQKDPTLGTVLLWMMGGGLLGWQFLELFEVWFKTRIQGGKA
jgi:hypothetical protein